MPYDLNPYDPEKRLLFNLCLFLVNKKLTSKGRGIRRPLSIKMKDFKCLFQPGQINPIILTSELENIKKELKNIAKTETNDLGLKLLVINNPSVLNNITRSYNQNKEIVLIYKRLEIEKYLNDLKLGDKQEERKAKENSSGMEIKSIYIVKPKNEDGKFRLVINEDYVNAKELQTRSKLIKTLIKLVENEENVIYDKNIESYFNSTPACPIYYGGKYKKAKILEKEGGLIAIDKKVYLKITTNIKTGILTDRQYKTQLKELES